MTNEEQIKQVQESTSSIDQLISSIESELKKPTRVLKTIKESHIEGGSPMAIMRGIPINGGIASGKLFHESHLENALRYKNEATQRALNGEKVNPGIIVFFDSLTGIKPYTFDYTDFAKLDGAIIVRNPNTHHNLIFLRDIGVPIIKLYDPTNENRTTFWEEDRLKFRNDIFINETDEIFMSAYENDGHIYTRSEKMKSDGQEIIIVPNEEKNEKIITRQVNILVNEMQEKGIRMYSCPSDLRQITEQSNDKKTTIPSLDIFKSYGIHGIGLVRAENFIKERKEIVELYGKYIITLATSDKLKKEISRLEIHLRDNVHSVEEKTREEWGKQKKECQEILNISEKENKTNKEIIIKYLTEKYQNILSYQLNDKGELNFTMMRLLDTPFNEILDLSKMEELSKSMGIPFELSKDYLSKFSEDNIRGVDFGLSFNGSIYEMQTYAIFKAYLNTIPENNGQRNINISIPFVKSAQQIAETQMVLTRVNEQIRTDYGRNVYYDALTVTLETNSALDNIESMLPLNVNFILGMNDLQAQYGSSSRESDEHKKFETGLRDRIMSALKKISDYNTNCKKDVKLYVGGEVKQSMLEHLKTNIQGFQGWVVPSKNTAKRIVEIARTILVDYNNRDKQ